MLIEGALIEDGTKRMNIGIQANVRDRVMYVCVEGR